MNKPKPVSQVVVTTDKDFVYVNFESDALKGKLTQEAAQFAKEGNVHDRTTYFWFVCKPTYNVQDVVDYLQTIS